MNQGNKLQDCADDWMSRDLKVIEPDSNVQLAAQMMAKEEVGSLIVKKQDKNSIFGFKEAKIEGIVTDTDIVRKVIAKNLAPEAIQIHKIMSSPVKKIPSNYPMIEICRMMTDYKIKRLPVVKEGHLKGMMSITDVMYAMVKLGRFYDLGKFVDEYSSKKVEDDKAEDVMKVKKWMTKPVLTINKETTMLAASQIMEQKKLGALPVTAGPGYVIGIITDTDMVKKIAATSLDPATAQVQEMMTKDIITGRPEQSLFEVVQLLAEKKLKRLPITDDNNYLLGIISITDIISILLQLNNVSQAQKLVKMLYKGTADYFGR